MSRSQIREIKDDDIMNKIKIGDTNFIKKLIEGHPDKIDQRNSWGQTYLMAACRWGKTNLVNLLIDNGACLNITDEINGSTALHYAVWWRQHQAVTILISRGSDVNKKENDGWTPLHLAAAILGKEWKDGVTILLQTQGKNMIEVNQRDNSFHRTPLHFASFWGRTETVRALLTHDGIDANLVDDDGNTPLHLAVQEQRYDVVTLMLSQDCSVQLDIKNRNKMTPLLEAVSKGHLGMVHKFIARGADINAVNHEDENCLHLAVNRVFHSKVEPLIILDKFCEELKLRKKEKLSGVVVACYLALQGADFYCVNKNGLNPLDLLKDAGLKEKLRKLFPPLCRCQEKRTTDTRHQNRHIVHCKYCCSELTLKKDPVCPACMFSKSGFETPELNEKFLQKIAQDLGDQWQQVGRYLGIRNVQLKIIMCDNPNNTVEQSFQMLYRWFKSCDTDTRTFRTLGDALKAAHCFSALENLSLDEK